MDKACALEAEMPPKIRVSLASAVLLGLTEGVINTKPTTLYLLTYRTAKCVANCSFCSQARSSTSKADRLSRVSWPVFSTPQVIKHLKNTNTADIKRVCIQAMNYPDVFQDLLGLVQRLHTEAQIPISISCQPLTREQIIKLKDAGVDRVGIPLDVPTKELFEEVKGEAIGGPYVWEKSLEALRIGVQVLGRGKVSTHFIVGLGESDKELLTMVQKIVDMGVYPALFTFTPLPGTRLEGKVQPLVDRYRCIQLARYMIVSGQARCENIVFDEHGCIKKFNVNEFLVREMVKIGVPFMTSGCPGCNRPFYNERAGGPLYNYPRCLSQEEINEVEMNILRYING
ncbi:MAG: radical SAM protein [Candidatus Bathyarchaeota archaeon]